MAAASSLSIIRWKRRGLNLSSVCPAAAPATGWTGSCAVLPPICAATWIGKSPSRAFNGVTVAPINRGAENLIRPPTGRTESPDSIISTAAAAEFRSEHLWSARIRSVGPEGVRFRECGMIGGIHCNVTAHPTAAWTRQQLRQALGFDTHYGYLLHDRDSIFSRNLDAAVGGLGLRILKTPPRCPMANGLCERVSGTIRRECLDWLIPLSEAHLRQALRSWVEHYKRGRPHIMLGPGVPDPPAARPTATPKSCHHLRDFGSIRSKPVLGGLHHEYSLCPA